MARYRIDLRVEREQGKRHPETKVTWGCTFLPGTYLAGGVVPSHHRDDRRPEEVGEMFGVYEAIKHAELDGGSLARDDIEVIKEGLTHIFRREKVDRSTTGPNLTRSVSASIFHEVDARPRPLGGNT